MTKVTIASIPDAATFKLVGAISLTAANPVITFTGDDPTLDIGAALPDYAILTITATIASDGSSNSEIFYVGSFVDNGDGTYQCTTIYRSLKNNVQNNPPQATDSLGVGSQKSHSNNAAVIFNYAIALRTMEQDFASNATSTTETSGEAFAIRSQLSLHTDGKYYKYHATNYPNWVGTASEATSAADESFTLWRPGYLANGFTGLTIGAVQYAEETGATTETPSATTTPIGTAESATEIRLKVSLPSVSEASQVQAEAGTAQNVYNSPLRSEQHRLANLDTAETLSNKTLKDIKIVTTAEDTNGIDFDNSALAADATLTVTEDASIQSVLKAKDQQSSTASTNTVQNGTSTWAVSLEDSASSTTIDSISFASNSTAGVTISKAGLYVIYGAMDGTYTFSGAGSGYVAIKISGGVFIGGTPPSVTGVPSAGTDTVFPILGHYFASGSGTDVGTSGSKYCVYYLGVGAVVGISVYEGVVGYTVNNASVKVSLISGT